MEYTTLQLKIAVSILKETSNIRLRHLLDEAPDLENFFTDRNAVPLKASKLFDFASYANRQEALKSAEQYLHKIHKEAIDILYYKDTQYAQRLLECHDAPILVYKKGNFDLNMQKVVAVVGTRNITSYGRKLCEDLILSLKDKNVLVISGLAHGVDVYIHELCLKYGIPTVGVLGHGFDFMYPAAHRGIAKEMMENGGLLSEFLPDTRADRIHFPMRNRIIAGLADATIVIESGAKGGSLITADIANGYNRDVFAFPGDVYSEYSKGCNQLIKQNKAMLINSGKEFIEFMSWDTKLKSNKVEQTNLFDLTYNLEPKEKEIYAYIKKIKEVSKDELFIHFNHFSSELFGLLLSLEMQNIIETLPSGRYKIKRGY